MVKAAKPKKNDNTIILFGDNNHTVIAHLKKRLFFVRVPHCSFRTCSFVLALVEEYPNQDKLRKISVWQSDSSLGLPDGRPRCKPDKHAHLGHEGLMTLI